jgi:hypothetical protein
MVTNITNPSCLGLRAVADEHNMLNCVLCGFVKVNSIRRRISHIVFEIYLRRKINVLFLG